MDCQDFGVKECLLRHIFNQIDSTQAEDADQQRGQSHALVPEEALHQSGR